jgi:phage tail sheath protein FI
MATVELSSGINIREEEPRTRVIEGVSTAVLAAMGVTERGPHAATKVTSFQNFLDVFGGDIANGDLVHAIRGFFDEGGAEAWIRRIVHYTTITDADTAESAAGTVTLQSATASASSGVVTGTIAGPWELTAGETLLIKADGGSNQTVTFDAVAATVTGSETQPFALSNGLTLLLSVDGGTAQPVEFLDSEFSAIGSATALEVAAVINAKATGIQATVSANAIKITSDVLGTDSRIQETGGTAATILGLASADNSGTGDVGDISAVTAAEAIALIAADTTDVTASETTSGYLRITRDTAGASYSVQVHADSELDDEFGLDNAVHAGDDGAAVDALVVNGKTDGSYTDTTKINITAATSGETEEFNLQVVVDDVVEETFANITMESSTAERYALTIINADSNLISVEAPDTPLDKRPETALSAYMTGGDDGLTGLVTADWIGDSTAKTGIYGFDYVTDARLLIAPGLTAATGHEEMLTYTGDVRGGSMFAILDPPEDYTAAEIIEHVVTTAALYNLSEFGAIYFPRVKVLNPNTTIYGNDETLVIPPSGLIAGIYARVDASVTGGVYLPPAGIERGYFRTVVGLESEETVEKANRDLLYPKRINPISTVNGRIILDGVRTLRGNSNFPTIAERRGVIFIEQSIDEGIAFARYRNNDTDGKLRAEMQRTINLFLLNQMNAGAFRSTVPDEAFNVDASDALNSASDTFAGRVTIKIGLATQKPAEFIYLIFTQDTRALDAELAAAGL